MGLKTKIVLVSLLVSIVLTASNCAKNIVLHPIERDDIFSVSKGTKIGETATLKDGYFISEYYLEEVARARVDDVK